MTAPAPAADRGVKQINLRRASHLLQIVWQDDTSSDLAFALLRARCRCAPCRSGSLNAGEALPAAAYRGVEITDVRPVGNYAVQLVFSDGHDRGIFPFQYLRELAAE